MVVPRETIGNGAEKTCPDCGVRPEIKVCSSMAGYYIGTHCDCGPYSRESDYFKTWKLAETVLKGLIYGRVNPSEE